MYLRALSLTDFRSYDQLEVAFPPGSSVLLGANGQGKTNVVEAAGYLAGLDSHRVAGDAALVRSGAARAVIRGAVLRAGRELLLEVELNPGRANRARVNRAPLPRPRELAGRLQTVLFAPEDLTLVKGDPEGRRRLLDNLLTARLPRFAGVRADYDRILKQRNTLLRTAALARRAGPAGDLRTLDAWDEQLARQGGELMAGRMRLVAELAPRTADAYEALAPGGGTVGLDYRHGLDAQLPADRELLAAALAAELARLRPSELDRGLSLAGPHRDDLLFALDGRPAKGYASHGESWSLALAVKLAAYRLLSDDGEQPVLILDDVFAELDARRRDRLAALVADAEQVLITAAVDSDVPAALLGARYEVAAGTVRRVQ